LGEKRGRPWSTKEKLAVTVASHAAASRAASLALLEPSRVGSGPRGDEGVACGGISIRMSGGADCFWAKMRRGKSKPGRIPFRGRPNRTANPVGAKIENRPF
jgi:hypothetical protein